MDFYAIGDVEWKMEREMRDTWGGEDAAGSDGWNSEYVPKRGGLVLVSMAGRNGVILI